MAATPKPVRKSIKEINKTETMIKKNIRPKGLKGSLTKIGKKETKDIVKKRGY